MTREEAIELCEHGACGGPVVYGDLKERMKMWAELAALLREPAAPGLTDSELETLKRARDTLADKSDLRELLTQLITRHTPVPKVEWLEQGCISTAVVGEWSVMVYPRSGGGYWHQIFNGEDHNDTAQHTSSDTRDDAKRAAEAKLRELMREGK